MENITTKDAYGNDFVLTSDDFTLVQSDIAIHDTKLETKPTTFVKDAFKRFCKNKSSIVGAIIILIIVLLAIFVPVFNTYDVKNSHPSETLVMPKLFKAGTGFWDGTKQFKKIDYNALSEYNQKAILKMKVYEEDGVKLVDFVYDDYEAHYGEVERSFDWLYVERYINNGWCEFSDRTNPATFKVLDDKCPVREIVSIGADGKPIVVLSQYRFLGYKSAPSFLFGTNEQGRDICKLAFSGLLKSLFFAMVIAAICFIFGLIWGAISGYFGGNVDLFMERFTDILGGVPMIIVVTLCRLHLGDSLLVFGFALCLTGWMGTAGRTRTQFYRFKGREYVLASRTLGASDTRLIFRHILPNALGTIVTSTVLMIPSLIFTEASLSYLGLGLQGGDSFGTILSDNQKFLKSYPMLIVFPSIIISLLMISFNLFGNGLRDALNPSLKGSE
ncbi:MAG: ABC transporter permease [Anaeroplasmataceae bacterium]|nr:ABC transporter permease [Anaeroplasmataceae bacterium]